MALPSPHPLLREQRVDAGSPSIGGSAVAGYTSASFRGRIVKFGIIAEGVITTADCTVTVAVNGTTIGTVVLPVASAAAGQIATSAPTTIALSAVNEDDVISFTPAGASGATIRGRFFAIIQAA